MPDVVEQFQNNALNAFSEALDPGRIEGLELYFSGTNASSTISTLADLGSIQLKRNGEVFVEEEVETFVELMNIRGGNNYFDSVSGGNFEATAFIPFYEKSFEQILRIVDESELVINYNPSTGTPGNFASLEFTLWSSLAFREEGYLYKIMAHDQSPPNAVTSRTYSLNTKNVSAVYVRDPNSILTRAGLRVDGSQVVTERSKNALIGTTLRENRLEVQTFDMIEMQVFDKGVERSLLNNSSILQLTTSGGGNVPITVTSVHDRQ